MKKICSRARQLEIAASFYSLPRGLRAIDHAGKNPRSRTRRVESSYQVFRRSAASLF